MTKKALNACILIALAILVAGCAEQEKIKATPEFQVSYTAFEGGEPQNTTTVYNDGTVLYKQKGWPPNKKEKKQLSSEDLEYVKNTVDGSRIFYIEDEYGDCPDNNYTSNCPKIGILNVTVNGSAKVVIFHSDGGSRWDPEITEIKKVILQTMTPRKPRLEPEEIKEFRIEYERTNYFASIYLKVTIYNNGSFQYYGSFGQWGGGTITETNTGQLSETEVEEFKKMMSDADILNLRSRYVCGAPCPTDQDSVTTTFMINGESKNIYLHAPDALPKDFEKLVNRLDSMAK